MLTRLLAYVRAWSMRRHISREVQDELHFHLESEIDANRSRGLSPEHARRRALADLGGLTHAADAVRDVRATRVSRVGLDLRDAVRGLRAGRSTTMVAFAVLSLAMAAGTVTYSVVDAVALRPLPYGSPEGLLGLSLPSGILGKPYPLATSEYLSMVERYASLVSLGGGRQPVPLPLTVDGAVSTVGVNTVTDNLFAVLGVRPVVGQFFGPEHARPGGPAAVVLSYSLWVRRFAADPHVVGREVKIGQDTRVVIGVLPEDVWYPITQASPSDAYVPFVTTPADRSTARGYFFVVARPRPNVTIEQARAELTRTSSAMVLPLQEQVVGSAKSWLIYVLAAVSFVILVACVNVAGLLLARGTARARELATREALGASRRRLGVGLLLEGLILALSSTAAGVALSFWGVAIVKANLPAGLTRVPLIAVNSRVLVASIIAAVICGLVFSSAPAWVAARSDLMGVMKRGGAAIGGRVRDRSLTTFLVVEVAFVCVLLFATTLVVTTFIIVSTRDLGFERRNVMLVWYNGPLGSDVAADRRPAHIAFRRDLLDRVRAVPGVTSVAIAKSEGPLTGGYTRYSMNIPGRGETPPTDMLDTDMVTPDYFEAMGMRIAQGRTFTNDDAAGAPAVMVISDVAARRFFPDRDAVGTVVTFQSRPTTIVGVLNGVRFDGPESDAHAAMYIPLAQLDSYNKGPDEFGGLIVRVDGDARRVAPAVVHAIKPVLRADPLTPLFYDDYFRKLTASRRFNAGMMAAFGAIALLIGAIGVYGTMAFFVAQQVRAIGVRMALGAEPARIMWAVLAGALGRVGFGVTIGLAGAWAISSMLGAFIFGVRANDPVIYIGVGGLLAVIGGVAALVPARRASRVDPLIALRQE